MARASTATQESNPHSGAPAKALEDLAAQRGGGRIVAPRPAQAGGSSGMPGNDDAETSITGADGNVIGSALDRLPVSESAAAVAPPQRYRVVNGGYINVDGVRHAMRAGKVIDQRTYDLKSIRQQGIKLEAISAEEESDLGAEPVVEPLLAPQAG